MPCYVGKNVIICTRHARAKKCFYCNKRSTILCDYKIDAGTCDRPCCREHSKQIGPDEDYCLTHCGDTDANRDRGKDQSD